MALKGLERNEIFREGVGIFALVNTIKVISVSFESAYSWNLPHLGNKNVGTL